jgi:predicted nucleic acid-binding protein
LRESAMELVVDTSAIIAVVTNEAHKKGIVRVSSGADLVAPSSLHWEVGNAFSAMLKRGRLSLGEARRALAAYRSIPIRFSDVELDAALELAARLKMYAYDAYVVGCALKHRCPLLTLDGALARAAAITGVEVQEIPS